MALPPHQSTPMVDSGQRVTTPWYTWFQGVIDGGVTPSPVPPPTPDPEPTPIIVGQQSIVVKGQWPALFLRLQGDQSAPAPRSYYGTDVEGAKGYHDLRMDAMGDVAITDPEPGQIIKRNPGNTGWENAEESGGSVDGGSFLDTYSTNFDGIDGGSFA